MHECATLQNARDKTSVIYESTNVAHVSPTECSRIIGGNCRKVKVSSAYFVA